MGQFLNEISNYKLKLYWPPVQPVERSLGGGYAHEQNLELKINYSISHSAQVLKELKG